MHYYLGQITNFALFIKIWLVKDFIIMFKMVVKHEQLSQTLKWKNTRRVEEIVAGMSSTDKDRQEITT